MNKAERGEPIPFKRKLAIAIHPLRIYENKPNREFIQRIFDNPVLDTTVAVSTGYEGDGDPMWQLFVKAKQTVSSPRLTGADIDSGKIKYRIVKEQDFIHFFENAREIQITLMGGEAPASDLEEGCHRAAFQELIKWFFDPENDRHKIMKIYIPFKGLFDLRAEPVNYKEPEWLGLFQKKYHSEKASKVTIGKSGAVFTFHRA